MIFCKKYPWVILCNLLYSLPAGFLAITALDIELLSSNGFLEQVYIYMDTRFLI